MKWLRLMPELEFAGRDFVQMPPARVQDHGLGKFKYEDAKKPLVKAEAQ